MRARSAVLHFACTQCGKCCNRAPEVELSEAAALLDVFVFRLMFRLYWLPQQVRDYRQGRERRPNWGSVFFEKKRLLNAFCARKYRVKALRDGKPVAYTKYLLISALALDTIEGACSALSDDNRCGIYDRRPLSCRSVPLHYSRAEANSEPDLDAFVKTSGYRCETGEGAPIILEEGRIVDLEISAARSAALALAARDRPWGEAIVQRMGGFVSGQWIPSLEEIEANAGIGAVTISMRPAWRIAADIGFITTDECNAMIALQLQTIREELASARRSNEAIETLTQMERDYSRNDEHNPAIAIR